MGIKRASKLNNEYKENIKRKLGLKDKEAKLFDKNFSNFELNYSPPSAFWFYVEAILNLLFWQAGRIEAKKLHKDKEKRNEHHKKAADDYCSYLNDLEKYDMIPVDKKRIAEEIVGEISQHVQHHFDTTQKFTEAGWPEDWYLHFAMCLHDDVGSRFGSAFAKIMNHPSDPMTVLKIRLMEKIDSLNTEPKIDRHKASMMVSDFISLCFPDEIIHQPESIRTMYLNFLKNLPK